MVESAVVQELSVYTPTPTAVTFPVLEIVREATSAPNVLTTTPMIAITKTVPTVAFCIAIFLRQAEH
jgi:hypothetical protein